MSTATAPASSRTDLSTGQDESTGQAARASSPNPPTGPDAPAKQLSHREILEVMTGLLAALFTALLSSTIVSTALPTIMSDLHGTQRQYTWVITSSLLALTITTPIWGKLSDLFSKKLLVQLSIVLFVLGSIGAGASQSVPPMMAFRAVQGVAMGGLTALTQSIIGSIIPPRARGRYSGYMGAVIAVSTVSGPLLGGVITQHLDWRYCFYVCVPLAVVAMILLQKTLRLPTVKREVHFDYLGAVLIAVVAALPMLWVTFAGKDYGWISWQSGLFLLGFLIAGVATVITELKVRQPMVPIRVLSNRTTALMIVASLGVGIALYGSSTFLTQYFQLAKGSTPTQAGLMTIPLILAQMLASTIGGQIVSRTGRWKPIMLFGSILLLIGLGGMATIDHNTPYWHVAIFMAVMGIGVGTLIQNIVLAVQNTVDVKDIGSSSATISFFRSLSGAVGVTVLGAVLADRVGNKIADGLSAMGVSGGAAGGGTTSLNISSLPAPIQALVHTSYGDTFGILFLIGGVVAVSTLIAVIAVREVPLRTTIELKPQVDQAGATEQVGQAAEAAEASHEEPNASEHVGSKGSGSEEAVLDSAPDPAPDPVKVPATQGAKAQAGESSDGQESGQAAGARQPAFDHSRLDDPSERLSVAAMDVLAAAQDQARAGGLAGRESNQQIAERIDQLGRDVDAALTRFHGQLDQIKAGLGADRPEAGGEHGVGGTHLREYEYGLLLNSQQTAERVTRIARLEAERILTEADTQAAELQQRIDLLRETEAELSSRVEAQLDA